MKQKFFYFPFVIYDHHRIYFILVMTWNSKQQSTNKIHKNERKKIDIKNTHWPKINIENIHFLLLFCFVVF